MEVISRGSCGRSLIPRHQLIAVSASLAATIRSHGSWPGHVIGHLLSSLNDSGRIIQILALRVKSDVFISLFRLAYLFWRHRYTVLIPVTSPVTYLNLTTIPSHFTTRFRLPLTVARLSVYTDTDKVSVPLGVVRRLHRIVPARR